MRFTDTSTSHEESGAELKDELQDAEEELAAFNPRSFYDEETTRGKRERLKNRVAGLRAALRRERRSSWENHRTLRQEKRDLVRELEEVEEDEEVLSYLARE